MADPTQTTNTGANYTSAMPTAPTVPLLPAVPAMPLNPTIPPTYPRDNPVDFANGITLKLPQFMETAADGWFTIVEAQFFLRRITQEQTKFFNALAALPAELIRNLPRSVISAENYSELKRTVIATYEKSKPEIFDKLINSSSVALTGRPSMYLRELCVMANKVGAGEDLVKHKFLQALPTHIAPILAATKALSIEQLGTLADEMTPYFNTNVMQVESHVAHMSRNQDQSSSPGVRPYKQNQRPKVCRAHLYFGTSSRTCKAWCQWPAKDTCRITPNSRPASPAPSTN